MFDFTQSRLIMDIRLVLTYHNYYCFWYVLYLKYCLFGVSLFELHAVWGHVQRAYYDCSAAINHTGIRCTEHTHIHILVYWLRYYWMLWSCMGYSWCILYCVSLVCYVLIVWCMFITLYWAYSAAVTNLEAYLCVERIASHYLDRTQSIAELFDVMDKIRRPLNNDRLVRWLFH